MSSPEKKQRGWGPEDYWRFGPVYVRKRLALLAVTGLSAAVLMLFGFPFSLSTDPEDRLPAYRWNDPELAEISGSVRVLDGADRARYIGEVDAGSYTGRGKVFDEAGELLYDGPLVDGVYEGPDAKVYQSGVLVYTGEMAGNLYEGQGRRIDPETGIVSEGQFSGGLLEGQGQEFHGGGALLREGTFSRDLLEGEGCEYSADGVLLREYEFLSVHKRSPVLPLRERAGRVQRAPHPQSHDQRQTGRRADRHGPRRQHPVFWHVQQHQ